MQYRVRRLTTLALLVALAVAGCGDEPTSGPTTISGTWSGFIPNTGTVAASLTLRLSQNEQAVTGTASLVIGQVASGYTVTEGSYVTPNLSLTLRPDVTNFEARHLTGKLTLRTLTANLDGSGTSGKLITLTKS